MTAEHSLRRLALLACLVSACAAVPEESGFGDAAALVQERSGHEIRWNRGSSEDEEVAARVRALLEDELEVEEAVQIALLRNRHLQALYEDLRIAQADLVEAGLLRNPIFHAEVLFPEGGGRTGLDLGLEQDFLSILFLPLRKRVAEASFEATQLLVAGHVLGFAGDVRVAFHRMQGAEQLVELRRTVVAATEASSELALRLHEAGNIRDLDRDNELVLHEESRLELAEAMLELAETRERLNALMGLWGPEGAAWHIASRLPELPAEEPPLEGIESRAVAASLALEQRRIEIEREADRLGFVRESRILRDPAVGASAERESESGLWSVGPALAVSLPLFNQGQPAVARAVAVLTALQESYAADAVELRSDVREAASHVLARRGRADFLRRVVLPLRARIVHATQLQYNAMQEGAFELFMAKREEIAAGAAYVEELRAYWIARAELERILSGAWQSRQQFEFEQPEPLMSRTISPAFFLQEP